VLRVPLVEHDEDARLVDADDRAGENLVPDGFGDGPQEPGRVSDPVAERRPVQVDAFARQDRLKTVQREVIAVLRGDDMGQKARLSPTSDAVLLDGARRRWERRDRRVAVAGGAAIAVTDVLDDEERGRLEV
jgi:hypothetical protein